MPDPIYSIL